MARSHFITPRVLVLGVSSAIATAVARNFAHAGAQLYVVARNLDKLGACVDDLRVRGAKEVHARCADLCRTEQHPELIASARATLGGLDYVLIAHGALGVQHEAQQSYEATLALISVNYLSAVSLLTILANDMEREGGTCIAAITSVAGDRGRASNYIYGSAKGALSIFLSGLRNRLEPKGVRVLDLKLGLVDTPMTASLTKNFLWARPESVGRAIFMAMQKRNDVLYLPHFWYGIMLLIRALPERIFKRLRL